jgi:nucleoside-diphosphate-sugar epimerase
VGGAILVTGATGFLGGALLRRLHSQGEPVIGLGRDPARCAALRAEGLRVVQQDLAAPFGPQARAALGDIGRIVHAAARSSPFGTAEEFTRDNVVATRHLLDFAQSLGVRGMVYISSSSVCFALKDQLGVRESDPLPKPFNEYARSKVEAEKLVLAQDGAAVVLRPRGIYGPGDTALLPRLLRAVRQGPLPLLRGGRARIDLTHVDDVIAAILAALDAGGAVAGQVFNISGGEVLPITTIATQACARAGLVARWRRMPLWPLMVAAGGVEAASRWLPGAREPAVTRYGLALFAYAQSLDLSKARARLGWQPQVSFEEGLARSFPKGRPG